MAVTRKTKKELVAELALLAERLAVIEGAAGAPETCAADFGSAAVRRLQLEYHAQRVVSSVLKVSLEITSLEDQLDRSLELILSIPQLSLEERGAIFLVEGEPRQLVLKASRGFAKGEHPPCLNMARHGNCLCAAAVTRAALVFDVCTRCLSVSTGGAVMHGHYCVPILQGGDTVGLINVFVRDGHARRPDEEKVLAMVADTLAGIIRHHRAETAQDQLRERLLQAEKLAALGRLTASFAHELRNPLTVVGGLARRLHGNTVTAKRQREFAGAIVSEVERLENVLRNMLTISQAPQPFTERHNVSEIVEYLLNSVADRCAAQGIAVHRELGETPPVPMHGHQVREALDNLIANAIEAMPAGGDLTVAARAVLRGDTPYVLLEVRDTGEGIPEDRLDLIFEPFYTSRAGKRRSGLGLASTRTIVENHGGFIEVESKPGAGSTFSLGFPVTPRAEKGGGLEGQAFRQAERPDALSGREYLLLRDAMDNTNEAIVTIDEESTVLFFNKAAEQMFGWSRREVLGRSLARILGPGCREGHKAAVARFVQSGKPRLLGHETEFSAMRKGGGAFPAAISFSLARREGKYFFTGIVRDLSETRAMQEKLFRSEQLAALGQAVAEINHEIKNPLMLIGGFARQLQKTVADTAALKKLAIIQGEVERLENLLKDLRDLYSPKPLALETVDLAGLVREVAAMTRENAEARGIRLVIRDDGGDSRVQGDRERLKQVALNLVKNGMDAMEAGGELTLGVEGGAAQVVLTVTDQGRGMPPEVLEKVFTPFYTTKKEGTGLGLCISRRIVEEHRGGSMALTSSEGKGTVATLTFARNPVAALPPGG